MNNDINELFGCLGCLVSPFIFLAVIFLGIAFVKFAYRLAFGV